MNPEAKQLDIQEEVAVETAQVAEAAGGSLVSDMSGRKWRIRVFAFGTSKNRYEFDGRTLPLRWTEESARSAVKLLDGAPVYAGHDETANASTAGVKNLIGHLSNPGLGPKGPEADLNILESEEWAQRKLLAVWNSKRPLLQFSIRAGIMTTPRNGAHEVQEVGQVLSVDLVARGSSGGGLLEILESSEKNDPAPGAGNSSSDKRSEQRSVNTMRDKIKKILESLRSLPKVGETHVAEATAIETELKKEGADEGGLLARASEAFAAASTEIADRDGAADDIEVRLEESEKRIAEAERKQKVAEARHLLHTMISESRLPVTAQRQIREDINDLLSDEQYDPAKITKASIEAKIKRVRESLAPLVKNDPTRISTTPATVGLESRDRVQIAMHKLLGVMHEYKEVHEGQMVRMVRGEPLDSSIPKFSGIREAYIHCTGDREVRGEVDREALRHVAEDWTAADFANVLGSSITRKMLQDYQEPDFGLDLLVPQSNRVALSDFRQQERTRVGYFGDLPIVEPETADYAELARPTDEKVTYTAVQRGGIITVTRKMILADDLGTVNKIVGRLGRSARRTLAQVVFNLMVNNAAIYDSVTWFHSTSHGGNLTTTALSAAELDVIRAKMRNQTEKDSGKRLGIGPAILVVPHELEGTSKAENTREFLDSNLAPSKIRYMFGQNNERIIVSPLLTDATDFFVFADQTQVPCIELGFIQGRQEPELILADGPTSERVFTSDRIRWKVRHEYEAAVTDFRGAHRATVAG